MAVISFCSERFTQQKGHNVLTYKKILPEIVKQLTRVNFSNFARFVLRIIYLIQDGENCTIYTLQFLRDVESEFEKFVTKFREDAEYSEDFSRIAAFIKRIAKTGALERYFRPEGKMNDSVVALPVTSSKLRLYCLRLSDKILVLGNGGVKASQRYEDDTLLNGYVMTLQKFEKLLRQEVANGNVNITESTIETDNIFEL